MVAVALIIVIIRTKKYLVNIHVFRIFIITKMFHVLQLNVSVFLYLRILTATMLESRTAGHKTRGIQMTSSKISFLASFTETGK